MTLHPEDLRYWLGWLIAGVLARIFLVGPILWAIEEAQAAIVRAIREGKR